MALLVSTKPVSVLSLRWRGTARTKPRHLRGQSISKEEEPSDSLDGSICRTAWMDHRRLRTGCPSVTFGNSGSLFAGHFDAPGKAVTDDSDYDVTLRYIRLQTPQSGPNPSPPQWPSLVQIYSRYFPSFILSHPIQFS